MFCNVCKIKQIHCPLPYFKHRLCNPWPAPFVWGQFAFYHFISLFCTCRGGSRIFRGGGRFGPCGPHASDHQLMCLLHWFLYNLFWPKKMGSFPAGAGAKTPRPPPLTWLIRFQTMIPLEKREGGEHLWAFRGQFSISDYQGFIGKFSRNAFNTRTRCIERSEQVHINVGWL